MNKTAVVKCNKLRRDIVSYNIGIAYAREQLSAAIRQKNENEQRKWQYALFSFISARVAINRDIQAREERRPM